MAVTQRLDLRQSQTLVMTPQLQQAIKLLELSNQELTSYVEQELEQNPLLERGDDARAEGTEMADGAADFSGDGPEGEGAETAADNLLDASDYGRREVLPDERDSPLDTDYENVYSSDGAADGAAAVADLAGLNSWRNGGGGGGGDFGDGEFGLEHTLSRELTLHEHLEQQLGLDIADPTERLIGLQLIDLVDEAGYIRAELTPIAERLNCDLAQVEAVLRKLQQLDPIGVCARDLAECLALQLKERDRLDPAMQTLLQHLDLLAKHDRAQLMKLCGVDAEDLADMILEIRSLNPRPGASFDKIEAQTIVPDILVYRQPDGSWGIELNADTLPRLLVNQQYYAQVSGRTQSKQDKDYLAERLSAANWLVKTLHQRATTILKVASEIVRQQEAFFLHGVQHLKPLIRRDIANAIEMHESTVSRVATNKYMATPRGLYEMRYFFSAAIQGANGVASHSAESVRSRIKELIDAEPANAVLSDDQLVAILKGQGVDIARRTVAKYRESLKIQSSVQRRREKALRSV
ncbi:RNA polymerase factor sigma-54 [Dongia soli]|uniref:RNA polymerase sigma-54 factor n=1 Tax=Dongia soli TaxID=600628 RepID=A0ABU5E6K9_9PROT|nr:RNA polymerase factor sigma-54 [Dongia soli]MDY0881774.1 RNA polymerase factor sigma-54 [Dongia soli]